MLEKPIAIVDIETTGVSSRSNRIIEIAVIKYYDGKIIDEFSTLINPGRSIPWQITSITGIKTKNVEDAPFFDQVAEKLDGMFQDSYFLAHHVVFDFSFVKRQMEVLGFWFRPQILCSVKLSRALYPENKGHSLEKIINRHNIKTESRHRAYDDAKAVLDFMELAAKQHGDEVVRLALKKQLKLKSLPSNFDDSYLKDAGNTPGVYIFKDNKNVPVYIGKSVTLRNRILSHFNQSSEIDKEMKISQATHKLEVIDTDSELEALLLESRLIKEKLPVYNRKLRRKKLQTVLLKEKNEDGYYRIKLHDANLAEFENPNEIFGVYNNRRSAKQAILKARQTFDLCSKLLGLENTKRACFYYQLGKCKGACLHKELPDLYNLRFELAFERSRIKAWKYKGPVLVNLSSSKGLVVDQWMIRGMIEGSESSEPEFVPLESTFDMDDYKILQSYLIKHKDSVSKLNKDMMNMLSNIQST